jgi:F-type H+-transporting ATPase subunit b
MKAMLKYSFMFIALMGTVAAAEEAAHHEASLKDLMYPTINFVVLVAFLVWKLKAPMKKMFDDKAADVQSLMNSAAQKNKDAEERLKKLQAKMADLGPEVAKIQKDYEQDVATFTQVHADETQSNIARTKRDFEHKLDGEKNELVERLNEDLLNSVIAKTQQTIKGNSDMKNRATSKIVSELR